jgi:hypothetical protein
LNHKIQVVQQQLEEMQQGRGLSFSLKPLKPNIQPIPPTDEDFASIYILLKPCDYYKS